MTLPHFRRKRDAKPRRAVDVFKCVYLSMKLLRLCSSAHTSGAPFVNYGAFRITTCQRTNSRFHIVSVYKNTVTLFLLAASIKSRVNKQSLMQYIHVL